MSGQQAHTDRWFRDKRFGLFVHWGLYAVPAWHEQILWRGHMPRRDYEPLIDEFHPARFDPDEWLDHLQAAGMQYICFTTKHHDGFCMFDSAFTDYKVTNTPYGRDILGELAEACHRRGVPLGLYYSIPDWHHPNYPNLGRHHEMFGPRPGDKPDVEQYMAYVGNQVRELCTQYGTIHQFFWDVNVLEYQDESLNDLIRELQPQVVINDRGPGQPDYVTPERHVPDGRAFKQPTEACQALGRESWGFKADEDYYADKFIMQSMAKILAMGGSYLLNVGPRADGTFASENVQSLERIGRWYQGVREAYAGALPASHMTSNPEVLLTRRGNALYVHVTSEPEASSILLPPIEQQPEQATLLNTGEALDTCVDVTPRRWRERPCLRVRGLPVNQITDEVMVIRLDFSETAVD